MCEWLGCARAYSDVLLVVGGRALLAHRAVLASASPFLKGILLSCPIEESPTYIVLPDYDFEAMSSILYYIYNGEVTIEKHKIELCLDIIKSLQIYIDCEYLPHTYKLEINVNKIQDTEDVFQLDLNSKNPQKYVKFRKGIPSEELLKCSFTNVYNVLDKSQGIAETKAHTSVYENVHFKDRQRNSFLRDVFKETYPRNGKLNGQTSSVRAISNERYHGATSMLSSNANNKHLNTEDASAQPSHQKPHGISYLSMETESQQVQYQYTHNQINGSTHPLQMNNNDELASNFATLINTTRYVNESSNVHQIHNRLRHEYFRPKIANEPTFGSSEKYSSSNDNIIEKKLLHQLKLSRRPILNQVLDNPWSARKPANFIPIHKHDINCDQKRIEGTGVKERDKSDGNDSNNNVSTEVKDVINEAKDLTITPDSDSSKCSKCDQTFPTTESLSEHARCHTGRYNCPDCGKNFSQLRNFKYHMSVHRGTKEFAATCPVCGKYFNDRGYLSSHMKIHRNRKEYKCSMCPKSFNQRVAYNMHVRIHTGVKPHVCNECGKAFSRKMLLKQHQRTHSGERPYACPHCDKRFADRSNMTLHLRLHTGVKPFSCTLCPKSFTKKHHLKSHLNYHTGAKPYACSRCNLAFTQSSNMRTHMKKCTASPSSG